LSLSPSTIAKANSIRAPLTLSFRSVTLLRFLCWAKFQAAFDLPC
jgi:hypothetical protein